MREGEIKIKGIGNLSKKFLEEVVNNIIKTFDQEVTKKEML